MKLNFQGCSLSWAPSWTLEETLALCSCDPMFKRNGKSNILTSINRSPIFYKQSYVAGMVVRILGIQERERLICVIFSWVVEECLYVNYSDFSVYYSDFSVYSVSIQCLLVAIYHRDKFHFANLPSITTQRYRCCYNVPHGKSTVWDVCIYRVEEKKVLK